MTFETFLKVQRERRVNQFLHIDEIDEQWEERRRQEKAMNSQRNAIWRGRKEMTEKGIKFFE
jgi:hypothetical protein